MQEKGYDFLLGRMYLQVMMVIIIFLVFRPALNPFNGVMRFKIDIKKKQKTQL